jgi:peptidoglycan hydrolase CwlO-like protein
MTDQPLNSFNLIVGTLSGLLTAAMGLVMYFGRNLHTRFEKHLEDNQKAHEDMRNAISAIREEAGRVEERQENLKEQVAKVQLEIVALRADANGIPERVVALLRGSK